MINQLNFDLQPPKAEISRLTMLLYGLPKVGKSTFCSRFKGAFFIATEEGLSHLETRHQLVTSWDEFKQVLGLLSKNRDKFETLIIDTADRLCDLLERSILARFKISNINELPYGKAGAIFAQELKWAMQALISLNSGLIFTSHVEITNIMTPLGPSKKWGPSIPRSARKLILDYVDIIGFASIEQHGDQNQERRVLRLAPSQFWEAGDRSGKFPPAIAFKFAEFERYFNAKKGSKEAQQ